MNFYPGRGSLGYGQNCAQTLMGEIGTRDVNDCVQGIEECLQNMPQSKFFLEKNGNHSISKLLIT